MKGPRIKDAAAAASFVKKKLEEGATTSRALAQKALGVEPPYPSAPNKHVAPQDELIKGVWHFACPASALSPARMIRRILFGMPIVLGRAGDGAAFALKDVCPHRAAPLSAGRIGYQSGADYVECPYHGWQFSTATGRCSLIPALSEKTKFETSKIKVQRFPIHEANGLVWIYFGDEETPQLAPPAIGLPETMRPKNVTTVYAEGPFDEAVIGLVDPAHTPFVHKQWWWREGKAAQEKTKNFEPTELGFRMPPHHPSSNSRIYGFLGGTPTTEIEFRLPGLRLETIRNEKHTILGLTAITPAGPNQSIITHMLFWTMPVLTLLKPVISMMAHNFLSQDGSILRAQNENLSGWRHTPLYAGDPDVPAQWYHALKKAWAAGGGAEGFEHPLTEKELYWRT